MNSSEKIRLFVLQGAATSEDLKTSLDLLLGETRETREEFLSDPILADYLPQIAFEHRQLARRMSAYYEAFFVLENHIRDFIEDTLSEAAGSEWWDSCVPQVVKDNAKKIRDQEEKQGFNKRGDSNLYFTTFGELSMIIGNNWVQFGGLFKVNQEAVANIIQGLNKIRGAIMHSGSMDEDEALRLKIYIKQWFKLFA